MQAIYPGADAKTLEQAVSTPDRAADERRGQHALHVLGERQQRPGDRVRGFRRQDQPGHRPGAFAASRIAGAGAASGPGDRGRRDGPEVAYVAADADRPVFARQPVQRGFPDQLRHHQPAGRTDARSRRLARADLRRPVRAARLGEARPAGQARRHRRPKSSTRSQTQNNVNPAGQIGGEPVAGGPAVHLHGAHPGPPGHAGGIRQNRDSRQSGWLRALPARRRAGRAGHASLQSFGALQRRARRHDGRLPASGFECRRHRRRGQQAPEGAVRQLPGRHAVRRAARHHQGRHRRHPRNRADARDRARCW